VPAQVLGLGLVAPLLAEAPLGTDALLGGIAAVSLIITGAVIAVLGMRIPANVRSGVSVLVAGGVLTVAKIAVSAFPDARNIPVETLAPLLFCAAVVAAATGAYAVKKKSVPVLFDGVGIGFCFSLLLCGCGALRDFAGTFLTSIPHACGIFFIAAFVTLGIAYWRQRSIKGAS
jgi:Na+-translocating ferredoxin:NAD+ oxidoreductase subunit E